MHASLNLIGLRAFLIPIVVDLVKSFNVEKVMTPGQVAETVDLIIDEFPDLKPDDLKLCFKNAKAGQYGKLYGKIDCQDILTWIRDYRALKIENARTESNRVHREKLEEEKTVPPSKEVLEMLKRTREELLAQDKKKADSTPVKREMDNGQKWLMQFHRIWIRQGYKRFKGGVQYIKRYGQVIDEYKWLDVKQEQYARVKQWQKARDNQPADIQPEDRKGSGDD